MEIPVARRGDPRVVVARHEGLCFFTVLFCHDEVKHHHRVGEHVGTPRKAEGDVGDLAALQAEEAAAAITRADRGTRR